MTHIVALCQAALWREIWHTSCRRFVSLPLKRGTATNAFPLPQNGPPTFTTCSIAHTNTNTLTTRRIMCLMVCQNIKYCVLCLITCLAKLVDNSLHISGRPYCLPPAHLLTSSMRHNIHKGVTIVTIVRIVRIVTIVKIVTYPMCEQ